MNKIIIVLAVFIVGCNPKAPGDTSKESFGDFDIKVIDSCEYIEYDYGFGDQRVYSLTHKGNCKYCLQRNKQVIHDTLIYDPVMVKKFRPALPSELETIKNQNK